jgi:hypothetical protein
MGDFVAFEELSLHYWFFHIFDQKCELKIYDEKGFSSYGYK